MVRSKKVLSFIIAIIILCAMIAPCAISASAEGLPDGALYLVLTWKFWQQANTSDTLPLTSSGVQSKGGFSFGFRSLPVGDYDISLDILVSYVNGKPDPIPDLTGPTRLNSANSSGSFPSGTVSDFTFTSVAIPTATGWDVRYTCTFSLHLVEVYWGIVVGVPYTTTYATSVSLLYSNFDPEPDLSLPDSDVYSSPEMGMGYTNYTTNFPTFTQLNTPCNVDANIGRFTWVSVSDSSRHSVLLGRLGEYSFANNMVIRGSVGITINIALSELQVQASNLTAEFRFANGAEPSFPTYFSTSVPQTWESNFYLSSMAMGDFGTMINYTFYIVMSSDIVTDLGFTPLYPQVVFHNLPNTFDYAPYGFTFQYYQLSSPTSPLPPDYIHTWYDIPNTDNYYVTQNPTTYNPNAASELAYYVSLYTDQDDKIQEVIELAIANLFHHNDPNGMVSLFSTLAESFTTTNTDFHIYLPAVSIPWANSTLSLWPQTEIPFKTFIDAIPTVILVVVSFLFLLSGVLVYFRFYYKFLKDMTRGNYQF